MERGSSIEAADRVDAAADPTNGCYLIGQADDRPNHAFMLALFLLIGLRSIPGSPSWLLLMYSLFSVAAMVYIPSHLLLMQKRVYAQGWLKTSIKYLVLATVYSVLLVFAIVYAVFAGLSS
ncbi:MAG: hypothetical protein E6Q88_00475 [Lysobacteraceae bacterium]|nr:MAG: hypothetical protein E6Q88_00475 [Xanthomonadaceae bacterium]